MACDIAFKEGQSNPKIKTLKWKNYEAYYCSENELVNYELLYHWNSFKIYINNVLMGDVGTLEEAKQVCQEHFNKLVKSCLD